MGTIRAVCVVVAILATVSCSSTQTVSLRADGSGSAEVEIVLAPSFAAYLRDLNATTGRSFDAPLFDLAAIQEAVVQTPSLSFVDGEVSDPDRLRLVVEFDSVDTVLRDGAGDLSRSVRFEKTDQFRRLVARVDREAVEQFLAVAAIDPFIVESMLPPDHETTEAEYRDFLAWALEEYEEDEPLDRVFDNATVTTTIDVAGTVVQLRGGEMTDSGSRFVTPLIRAVANSAPTDYVLVFTPEPVE